MLAPLAAWYAKNLALNILGCDVFPYMVLIFGGAFLAPFIGELNFTAKNNADNYIGNEGGNKRHVK